MKLRPSSTLLIGPAGTGKTTSLTSILASGLKLRLLATEPSAPARVIEEAQKRKIPLEGFDWCFISPAVPAWESLIKSAEIVNAMSLKDIADMRTGIAKPDGKQWISMLKAIADFPSDRTGALLGDATEWGADCAFVIDGLTGLSTMSRNLTVGLKPNPAPGEWGVMQSNILTLMQKLCSDMKCMFVCIAHVERENNELTGLSNITVSTLGAKLAPKLPPLFTNVVYAKRIASDFIWSTADSGVDTKNGDLPLSDRLAPSFKPIIDAYRSRHEAATESAIATPQPQTTKLQIAT
jgi:hypothetical protein